MHVDVCMNLLQTAFRRFFVASLSAHRRKSLAVIRNVCDRDVQLHSGLPERRPGRQRGNEPATQLQAATHLAFHC